MAGHSKWANIRHRKERADAKKGKVFSRIAKEIITAVRHGGSDPKSNTRLRLVLQKARVANVPNDIIDRNIKKATSADQADFTETSYELYGYGGIGIIVEIMTDNRNRISGEMRTIINKRGGTIASVGSVAFNFERKGIIHILKDQVSEEELFAVTTEAGAEDFEMLDDRYVITTEAFQLELVKEAIIGRGFKIEEANLEMVPKSIITVDAEAAKNNQELIEAIEQLDDVDAIYHNMEFPEEK